MARYFAKLRGEKVYLSPMNIDDTETYTRWLNNLATTIALGQARNNIGLASERETVERLSREGHVYAIVERTSDTLVGNCGLHDLNPGNGTAEVGIFIGEEKRRGKGLGTDAMLLLASYAFKILGLHNLILRTASFNTRAMRCYEKVGFKEMGRRTEAILVGGRRHDDVYMQLLARDFRCAYLDDELPS